jgi:hypothetical protein
MFNNIFGSDLQFEVGETYTTPLCPTRGATDGINTITITKELHKVNINDTLTGIIVYKNGTREWYTNGRLHRDTLAL